MRRLKAYYNEIDGRAAAWIRQLIKMGLVTDGVVDERSIIDVEPEDLKGFDRVHFFAGIATWDLCLNRAGWGEANVWTASLPCQSFSSAGKQLGKADERHLLPYFLEIVEACKPRVMFGEQVEAAIKHEWLDDLSEELGALGYDVAANIIPASAVGAFHIRSRLWWVAQQPGASSEFTARVYRRPTGGDDLSGTRSLSNETQDDNNATGSHRSEDNVLGSQDTEKEGLVNTNEDGCQQRSEASETAGHGGTADATSRASRRLADSERDQEHEKQSRPPEIEGKRSSDFAGRCCVDNTSKKRDGMADSENRVGGCEPQQRVCADGEARDKLRRLRTDSGMGNTTSEGQSGVGGQSGRPQGEIGGHGNGKCVGMLETERPSTDLDWLYCRDDKYRPVPAGLQPLVRTTKPSTTKMVDGASEGVVHRSSNSESQSAKEETQIEEEINPDYTAEARAIRLKGYGNGIVADVATAFIGAYLDVAQDADDLRELM